MGVVVALAVLFSHGSDNIRLQVLTVASGLVSGALGAFAAHSNTNQITGSNPVVNQTPVLPQTPSTEEDK